MKYKNRYTEAPPKNTVICWLNPICKEVFGKIDDNGIFKELDPPYKIGFLPKYWRPATDIEALQYEFIVKPAEQKKRGRPAKIK